MATSSISLPISTLKNNLQEKIGKYVYHLHM
jgi:hypothetical protein